MAHLTNTRLPLVSFIGIGNMGMGMATRLHTLGWPVHVHDVAPQRQAQALAEGMAVFAHPHSLAAAMPAQGLLIVAVVDAAQCHDVMWGPQGAAAALCPGQTVMWCPTMGAHEVQALARRLADQGTHSIDAPMSGGPARARAGTMSLMVAGPADVLQAHQAVLAALADPVFDLGERIGDGARTKLVNNLLAGINLVGAAEALALAGRLGLNLAQTLDVIERSSGQSWIGSDRMRRAIAQDLSPRAHMTLLNKDTRLALDEAAQCGFSGPLGQAAHATFAAACSQGWEARDDGALLEWLQQSPKNH